MLHTIHNIIFASFLVLKLTLDVLVIVLVLEFVLVLVPRDLHLLTVKAEFICHRAC